MIKAVDLIIIAFSILFFGSVFLDRNDKPENSYSLQTMNCVKGIFAVIIVLFHLSQHIRGGMLFKIIGDAGYLSVAIFSLFLVTVCIHVYCKLGGTAEASFLAGFLGF